MAFGVKTSLWTSTWSRRHALVDQLSRASESLLLNLAEAARQQDGPVRLQQAEYAIDSSLECAGCLDLACLKQLLCRVECQQEKRALCEVTRMLVGLRKAWEQGQFREEPPDYGSPQSSGVDKALDRGELLFGHERLEVYRAGLQFAEWFVFQPAGKALSHRLARQIDEAATCIVLNIAEGNGRFSVLDHQRFVQIADRASVKAAVYLDLAVKQGLLDAAEVGSGKQILRRVTAMLGALWKGRSK